MTEPTPDSEALAAIAADVERRVDAAAVLKAPQLALPDVDPALVTLHDHVLGVQSIVDAGAGRQISILPSVDSGGRYDELLAHEAGALYPPLLGHRDVAVLGDAPRGIVGDGELWHITDDEARAVVGRVLAGDLSDFGV